MTNNSFVARIVHRLMPLVLLPMLLIPAGCSLLTAAAVAMPKYDDAKYKGMANQKIGVMVWADRGIAIDWPSIQLDLAGSIQTKLETGKADEFKGATWPVQAGSIVRYQKDHPEIEALDIAQVAGHLGELTGLTRLIYVEVGEFHTRSETAVELFRGATTANLKILEIANGKATVAYQEDGIHAIFPKKSAPEGSLEGDDYKIYLGTIDAYSDVVLERLTKHDAGDFDS